MLPVSLGGPHDAGQRIVAAIGAASHWRAFGYLEGPRGCAVMATFSMGTAVFEIGAALLGACVGSFLNVVVWRLPQEDPAKRSLGGRSHCPGCGEQIQWRDNVPVLGWLKLRGKARCCGTSISPRYPLVELLTAAAFYLLAVMPPEPHGPMIVATGAGLVFDLQNAGAFACYAIFLSLLIALTFIDFDTQLLPDALTKPGMAIGVAASIWPGLTGPLVVDDSVSPTLLSLLASVVGLLVGGGTTWAVRALGSYVFKKEAMGFGDVKLLAMIGAFLGWQAALLTLFLGCVFGAIVGVTLALRGGLGLRIPFGPYLAMGAFVSMFWQRPILHLMLVRWPDWQARHPDSVWLVLLLGAGSLFALLLLIRRGRRSG